MPRKKGGSRRATIILPRGFEIPEINLLTIPDLPEPHTFERPGLRSWRKTNRAHHRILISRPPRTRFVERTVNIPIEETEFEPFMTHWVKKFDNWYIVNHNLPDRKIDKHMNQRMRDFKHRDRIDNDHSRAASLRLVNHRSSHYNELYGALESRNVGVVADTALVLGNAYA